MSEEHRKRWSPENPWCTWEIPKYPRLFNTFFLGVPVMDKQQQVAQGKFRPRQTSCQTWNPSMSGFLRAEEPPRSNITQKGATTKEEAWKMDAICWTCQLLFGREKEKKCHNLMPFLTRLFVQNCLFGRKSTTLHKFTKNLTLQKQAGFDTQSQHIIRQYDSMHFFGDHWATHSVWMHFDACWDVADWCTSWKSWRDLISQDLYCTCKLGSLSITISSWEDCTIIVHSVCL